MKIIQKTWVLNQISIPYEHHITNGKQTILRIERDGKVVVVSNRFVPQYKIDELLKEKLEWLVEKQRNAIKKDARMYHDIFSDAYFYLMDQKFEVVRVKTSFNKIFCEENKLYVYYCDENKALSLMREFIKKQCEKYFMPMVDHYYHLLSDYRIPYPIVKYRFMVSRWGSCMPNKHQITFSTRLLNTPREFVEYVVLHELVHMIQPNHSKSFYSIISYYMPDYKKRISSW